MKIAILNIFSGLVDRGAEVWTKNIAEEMGKRHKVTVFQIGKKNGINFETKIINNIPAITDGFIYHFIVFLFTLLCFPDLIANQYDWIIPVNGRLQTLVVRFFRFFYKTKILIAGHAGVGREDRINIILGKPDIFVALSKKAHIWALNLAYSETEVVYIPNGIDTKKFIPDGKKIELKLGKPRVLCVSELLPYKRIECLIKAVKMMENLCLLLIGKGEEAKKIDAFATGLLGKRFLRIETVLHEKMPEYYRSCDIFSLPSKESEAFGLVYLEAMALNLPIVAPDDQNRRTIIGDAGIYANVENIKNYALSLKKAVKKNFSNLPRKQAEKFSWGKIVKEYEQVMEKR